MCLNRVDESYPPPANRETMTDYDTNLVLGAFKVVIRTKYPDVFRSLFKSDTLEMERVYSLPVMHDWLIYADDTNPYERGFHCFEELEDAKEFLELFLMTRPSVKEREDTIVVRVALSGITARGRENGRKVIVGRSISIKEVIANGFDVVKDYHNPRNRR